MTDMEETARAGGYEEPDSVDEGVEFVETDLWLNLSSTGRAVHVWDGEENMFTSVSLLERIIEEKKGQVLMSKVVDEEFVQSRYSLGLSRSTRALVLKDGEFCMVVPTKQVRRMLDGEISGVRFSRIVPN